VVIAACVLVLGFYVASQALALAVRQSATDFSLRLAPRNALILAQKAESSVANTTSSTRWQNAATTARQALLRDPLLPSAASTLAFGAGLAGDDRLAQQAFTYSQALSRRDLKTHLWAIEYAVARGDVAGALRHYNFALLTSRQAPAILFPVLAGAVASQDVRRALVPLLLKRTEWAPSFINFVANSSSDHRSAAALFGELRDRDFIFPTGAEASLLGALVTNRDYGSARSYLDKGVEADVSKTSRDPHFASNFATPSPFDWNLQNDVGLTTSIQQGDRGGIFTFSTVAGAGGPLLRQLQLLRPGRYEVMSHLTVLHPADALPVWAVQCVDGPELARFAVGAKRAKPSVDGDFTVDATCPAQWLTLAVAPNDSAGGVTGELNFAQIRPIGRR
jgi:hypothetical protein